MREKIQQQWFTKSEMREEYARGYKDALTQLVNHRFGYRTPTPEGLEDNSFTKGYRTGVSRFKNLARDILKAFVLSESKFKP